MARVPELGELVANRYRIQALAREGPGYITLHGFDRDVEVDVSLLWFRPGLFPSDEARREFLGNAVTIRGLTHPHLRRIYEAHVVRDAVFATAQVGSAANVSKRLGSKRPADELDILRYATSIGDGLEAAHRLGHIHGYLVPSDVVEVASQVKLTGVGLYRAASADVARDLFWTRRRYIAPEVLGGEPPTPLSDVYSMAAILAEISSGISAPDIGETLESLSRDHFRVADVLGRALRSNPSERHQSAAAVLNELRRQLVDDRVPTAELLAVDEPLIEEDTSPEIVLEADEPPESAHRRPTTERPAVSAQLAIESEQSAERIGEPDFDPNPISLVNVDGDPLAIDSPMGDEGPTLPATGAMGGLPPWHARDDRTPTGAGIYEQTTEYRISDAPPSDSRRLATVPAFKTLEKTEPPGPPPAAPFIELMEKTEPPGPPPRPPGELPQSFDVDMSPTTLLGMAPSSSPLPHRTGPEFVSHRPVDAVSPHTPPISPVDRPDLQPRLRPLASMAPRSLVPVKELGHYAAPRREAPEPGRRAGAAFWLWLAAGIMAIVLSGLVAVVVVRSTKGARAPGRDAAPAAQKIVDAGAPPPSDAAGPCEKLMVFAALTDPSTGIEGEPPFCIDRFEAPGRGSLPTAEVTLAEAVTACAGRGARLCTSGEWVAACRGTDEAPYPYGPRFQREACNTSIGAKREIESGGSYPECESAVGAFDMSGNVGEWVAEGFVHGGSAHDRSGGRCSRRWRGRADKGYMDVGYRCCAAARELPATERAVDAGAP